MGAVNDRGPVKAVPADLFIRRGDNAEMRWGAVRASDYLTPVGAFFVRSQSTTPVIDPDAWTLTIDGDAVRQPRVLGLEELKRLPQVTYVRALECAGNGRCFFRRAHGRMPWGHPWGLGAIGVAEWTGVRMADVLALAGMGPRACSVTAEGLDRVRVRRPLPVRKALEEDTLLVWAMNGEALTPDHGAPLRLLVSGWAGAASIKWLGRITVSATPTWTPWNTQLYVLTGGGYGTVDGRHPIPVEEQTVKSALALEPGHLLRPGTSVIRGRAWSPRGSIARVDISIDSSSWRPAQLREPNLPRAWTRFEFSWNAEPGDHVLRTRATDDHGYAQPEEVPWNDHGYLFGGVVEHAVRVRE
jgi:sulfane dehydrogenase subunit SoxC